METVKIEIDPTDAFKGFSGSAILAACGLLPAFAQSVAMQQPETAQQAFDMLSEIYGYSDGEGTTDWGIITKKGVYVSYDGEDPDLDPLVKIKLAEGIDMYVYRYAIVGIKSSEQTLITRMD